MAEGNEESTNGQLSVTSRKHYFQIEVIKTVMIILVILDHILPYLTKSMLYVQFWLRLSVPIFLIAMGFNYGHSLQHKGYTSLRDLYSKDYFKHKFRRYVYPFLILFIPLTLISIILDLFEVRIFSGRAIFPFWGPGIWYIPVVFSAVFVLPALYLLLRKRPYLMVSLCFANEVIMHLLLFYLLETTQTGSFAHDLLRFLFQSNVLLYLSAIALGLWFSTNDDLFSQKHRFIWIALPFSLMYLIIYQFADWRPFFIMSDYNFMMIPYAAFIFLVIMRLLPEKSQWSGAEILTKTGRSTYHILLVQAVIFSALYHFIPGMLIGELVFNLESYLILSIIIMTISFTIGGVWQGIETKPSH